MAVVRGREAGGRVRKEVGLLRLLRGGHATPCRTHALLCLLLLLFMLVLLLLPPVLLLTLLMLLLLGPQHPIRLFWGWTLLRHAVQGWELLLLLLPLLYLPARQPSLWGQPWLEGFGREVRW